MFFVGEDRRRVLRSPGPGFSSTTKDPEKFVPALFDILHLGVQTFDSREESTNKSIKLAKRLLQPSHECSCISPTHRLRYFYTGHLRRYAATRLVMPLYVCTCS